MHYSAVNSMQIPAAVARDNGFTRSGDTALVMINLQKPTPDAPFATVPAEVSGHARDLVGNRMPLSFQRIESAGSIYSLATVPISDDQTLTFDLTVDAVDGSATIPIEFTQTFFTQ